VTSNRETGRWWLAKIRRQLEEQMSVKILAAAENGVPIQARCNVCLKRWERPDDDPTADSLADFAHQHAIVHGRRHG
jgi:hypothetical protein